jgi:hypothetical protein
LATSARNRDQALENRTAIVLQRIAKLYGNPPKTALIDVLRQGSVKLDEFDWMLFIMSLEIDLKVQVPERLVKPSKLTLIQFAKAVTALPRVKSEEHTLETLQFLAGALLGESESRPARKALKKRRR